ncbi:hypothetical protein ACKI2N_008420 [Cupriavidus sp. 30B13]|uniref:hypothetical protein n=1 Tax=Cupriavidus sp. 30B13 TaxID=3384241 RepID=UPI003B91AB06
MPPLPADAAVPPPWGTSFDVRESLDAMRAAAVKRHLAAIGPGQARTLRQARQRSLVTGVLGGGVAVLALWLASIALRGGGPPPAAEMAGAPAPAGPAVVAETPAPVAENVPESVPESMSESMPDSVPDAVAALSPAVSAFAAAALPPAAAGGTEPAAAGVAAPPVAARQAAQARPVAARLTASRSALRPAGDADEDASYGDEAPEAGALDGWPRPSAAAYLPHDTPFELPAHTRLSDG